MSNTADLGPETIPGSKVTDVNFDSQTIRIISAPDGQTIDVADYLREPAHFHGDPNVHDIALLNKVFAGLIGDHEGVLEREGLRTPEAGVVVLTDHVDEASSVVTEIDKLAVRLLENPELYKDRHFCELYLELTRKGYGLLREYLPQFGEVRGIPISLERAGLVTTRLADGLELDAQIDNEVRVVTKRAHPKDGDPEDLLVTVKWRDLEDLENIDGEIVEITDFVNPASGASTLAMLAAARARGATPVVAVHRSIMATEQGIVFNRRMLQSEDMGRIVTYFFTVGLSSRLTENYYLTNPGVGDAGHVLQHFLPNDYQH